MTRQEPVCTEPSHLPVFRIAGQKNLYQKALAALTEHESAGVSMDDARQRLAVEFDDVLAQPSDYVSDGFRVQHIRRRVLSDWGGVFYRVENVANLAGWCTLACFPEDEGSELHYVQGLLLLQAIRNVLATIAQLRSALAAETLGYLRTLYEIYVKSEFLERYTASDDDLPGRFSYYNNTTYLDYYRRFSSDAHTQISAANSWENADQYYTDRFPTEDGKGDYGWAFPHITSKGGQPKVKPTFRDLMEDVDTGSLPNNRLYEISSSNLHGEFIHGGFIDRPLGVGVIKIDSFSTSGIDSIIDGMVPLLAGIMENAALSCVAPKRKLVMNVAKVAAEDIGNLVVSVRAAPMSADPN